MTSISCRTDCPIRRVVERGQESGEFRADLDPALAAVVFYGGIDELLTGWVLGQFLLPGR